MVMGKSGVNRISPPSGSAFLMASMATRAAPPGLFSTITVAAYGPRRRSARMRAITSVPPPAGKPTIIRTGFLTTWARAVGMNGATAATAQAAAMVRRVGIDAPSAGDGALVDRGHRYQFRPPRESRRYRGQGLSREDAAAAVCTLLATG